MKTFAFLFLLAMVGGGCSEPPNPATQMRQQIQEWVPKGTPTSTVLQQMEQHQFVCVVGSYDSRSAMPLGSDPRWWDNGHFITGGGKTLPVTNVTILTCKRAGATNDAYAYEATLTSVDGEFDGKYLVSAQRVR